MKLTDYFSELVSDRVLVGTLLLVVLSFIYAGVIQDRIDSHEVMFDEHKRLLASELDRRYIYGQGDKFVKEYSDFTHVGTCLYSLKQFLREADVDTDHFIPYCSKVVSHRKSLNFWRAVWNYAGLKYEDN